MLSNPLLIEFLTEELPQKKLNEICKSFSNSVFFSLKEDGVITETSILQKFATSRRLGVLISDAIEHAAPRIIRKKLLLSSIGLNSQNKPTEALRKKLKNLNIKEFEIDNLEIDLIDGKENLFIKVHTIGISITEATQKAIDMALKSLMIYQTMNYQIQDNEIVRFIRPVHQLIALHGSKILHVKALGLKSSNITYGHRFLNIHPIKIANASSYEESLEISGKVLADFNKRLAKIKNELVRYQMMYKVLIPETLLEEVCSLIEWPAVFLCSFDKKFLKIPKECLLLAIQKIQKCFAMTDDDGNIINHFLIVTNTQTNQSDIIIHDYEKVLQTRLEDMNFFLRKDKTKKMHERIPDLSTIIYHNKLGSQIERTNRIQYISEEIIKIIQPTDFDALNMLREMEISKIIKCDLLTCMVNEFPELQGIIGYHYCLQEGMEEKTAKVCVEHYYPKFSKDQLPESFLGIILAIADKIETITGIYGIGAEPNGENDPFALRRNAIGICRILIEKKIHLSIDQLLNISKNAFQKSTVQNSIDIINIKQFILNRLKNYLKDLKIDEKFTINEIESVIYTSQSIYLDNIIQKLQSVKLFSKSKNARELYIINKRMLKIIQQNQNIICNNIDCDVNLFENQFEIDLYKKLTLIKIELQQLLNYENYTGIFRTVISIIDSVNSFFSNVFINCSDKEIRKNRIILLHQVVETINKVANINKLFN